MPTPLKPTPIEVQTAQAVDPAAICSAWRDLQIGERIMPGDRILSRNAMTWNIWTEAGREVIVDKHTFPCQRLVPWPNK